MKPMIKKIILIILVIPFILNSGVIGLNEMRKDLNVIKHLIEVTYAPAEWKKSQHQWDLEESITTIKKSLNGRSTVNEYQLALKDLFASMRDYHVCLSFHSTKEATLPFTLRSVGDKVYVVQAEKDSFLSVGDCVLFINGEPAIDLLEEYRAKKFVSYNLTNQALAEIGYTKRIGIKGDPMPENNGLLLTIKKKRTKEVKTEFCEWKIEKEEMVHLPRSLPPYNVVSEFFDRRFIPFECECLLEREAGMIGVKKSFLPKLGPVLWKFPSQFFDASIFQLESLPVGYIRIPHFVRDERAIEEFAQIIKVMQKQTEALVIDQLNNPGGLILHLYDLLSYLTDQPLAVPVCQEKITEDNVALAVRLLKVFETLSFDKKELEYFEKANQNDQNEGLEKLKNYCHFLIDQYREGYSLTQPYPFFGIDVIRPNPKVQYKKPILVLINELDFSCADLFPAILQDNHRATLFGMRTAGAGGYVKKYFYSGLFGVDSIRMTGSIATRLNGQPIEDLGVAPDIGYELSERDYSENYADYVEAVKKAVLTITKESFL